MGVIYKLKEDVVAFILQQKNESPSVSCRKLAEIIQDTFHINVSKSSINTIIKDANLSNPVGRIPLGDSKKPKFKIPREKKVQMFQSTKSTMDITGGLENVHSPATQLPMTPQKNVEVSSPIEKKQDALVGKEIVVSKSAENTIEKNSAAVQPELIPENILNDKNILENSDDVVRLPLLPDPVGQTITLEGQELKINNLDANEKSIKSYEEQETVSQHFDVPKIDGILLRAAMWDLTRRPILETFLKRHTDLLDEEIKILDTLLCFKQFTFDDAASVLDAEQQWIWQMSGFEHLPAVEDLQKLLKRTHEINVAEFEFFMELSFMFSFASETKILLSDESIVTFDPRFNFFGKNLNQSKLGCPVDNAIENISRFMTDSDMEIVAHCPFFSDSLIDLKNVMALCQGVAHKEIKKIILNNTASQELMEFNQAPAFTRNIMVTAIISMEQLQVLVKGEVKFSTENSINDEQEMLYWADQEIKVQLSDVDLDKVTFRLIAFTRSIQQIDSVMITILPVARKKSIRCIWNKLKDSLSQVVDINNISEIYLENDNYLNTDKLERSLKDCLLSVKSKIEAYALKIFTPEHHILDSVSNICNLSGYAIVDDKAIQLIIKIPESVRQQDVFDFVKTVNAYQTCDYNSKKFHISIK